MPGRSPVWRPANKITAYDSPNIDRPDTQFWAVVTLLGAPSVQMVVADTDQFPGFVGQPIAGIRFVVGTELVAADDDVLRHLGM